MRRRNKNVPHTAGKKRFSHAQAEADLLFDASEKPGIRKKVITGS
jgi:hypothetical protein